MIRIVGLRKSYGDLVAVDGLDLDAHEGEILALLGPNGAGKSTTVQCIVGLLEPDAGTIVVHGHDIARERVAARRATSYVPEVARLYDALTPTEYLELKGRLFEVDEQTLAARIERVLDGFGLGDRRHTPMSGFSKGMTQKVSLAAALVTEPSVLVLDEPLSGLDVETTLVVKEVLRGFAAGGRTVLYSSHVLDVVETLADRVAVLDRGRLVACGTMAELREQAGAGAGARLEALFQQLTRSADPVARARRILDAQEGSPNGR
jgi:ABC-2 type transport system ATP-binding protein